MSLGSKSGDREMSGDIMTFPDTWEEFVESYKIVDTEHIYTNGAELIPVFRVEQWLENERSKEK